MRRFRSFSLIEVVISLGVLTFALLTTLALLPMGVKTNRVSAEETRATFILTELEADLRNTHPLANGGNSRYFGLVLPYTMDASGRVVLNPDLTVNTAYSVGLDENERTNGIETKPPLPYEATVLYTRVPEDGLNAPVEARLIVSWPCIPNATPVSLTSLTNVAGFVESYVSFPAP